MAHAQKPDLVSAKRTSPFKSAGVSVQSTAGSRDVRVSGSNAGYAMFRGSVKSTGYPLHSPVSLSLPLPCVTVCHHVSTGLYHYSASAGKTELNSFFSPDPRNGATIQRQTFRERSISYLDGFLSSLSKVTCFPGQ